MWAARGLTPEAELNVRSCDQDVRSRDQDVRSRDQDVDHVIRMWGQMIRMVSRPGASQRETASKDADKASLKYSRY